MRTKGRLGLWFREVFRRAEVEGELDEELRHHLEREVEERVRRGADPSVARREAALAFGGVERWKEECRDERSWHLLDDARMDVAYGLRSLRRSPVFSIVVVSILALGSGLTAALAAAFHGILLKPLPYRNEERVRVLWQSSAGAPRDELAPATFLDLEAQVRSFDALASIEASGLDGMGPDGPESLNAWAVSPRFFDVLGTPTLLGRTFLPGEHVEGADRVLVLSHRFWQRRFAGDRAVVGRTMILDGAPHRIIGVMPPGFAYPTEKEIWIPLVVSEWERRQRFATYWTAVGRLAPGTTAEAAQGELDTVAARLAAEHPRSNAGVRIASAPLREEIVGEVRPILWVLLSAVVVLLLTACSNVAHLFLARTTGRARELAVRVALGARRGRVVRQLLAEGLLLSVAGCGLGWLVASGVLVVIRSLAPTDLPRLDEVSLEPAVLALAAFVCTSTVLTFAAVPAARAAGRDPREPLAASGTRVTAGARRRRLGRAFVIAEVALSFVLVVGTGLLVRTFVSLTRVAPGYRAERVLALSLFLYGRYDTPERQLGFLREVTDRVGRLPGVRSAGLSTSLPLMEQIGQEDGGVTRRDGGPRPGEELTVRAAAVSPGYFSTLEIPLRGGRLLDAGDDGRGEPVALISEELARQLFPGEDPLGRMLAVSFPRGAVDRRIVGVVGDVRHGGLDETPGPVVYVPLFQTPIGAVDLTVRTDRDPVELVGAVSEQIWALAPTLPLQSVVTFDSLRESSLRVRRLVLTLLAGCAGAALLLAALGVYGLLSGAIAERRREICLRLVLGARRGAVLAGVLGDGTRMAVTGLVLGTIGAVAGTRLLDALLYDVTPLDAASFAGAALVILAAALLAGLVPGWRAARVDPVSALAAE